MMMVTVIMMTAMILILVNKSTTQIQFSQVHAIYNLDQNHIDNFSSSNLGDIQGDRRDDPDGGQERGWEDQLQRVQSHDGGSPLAYSSSPFHQVWPTHLPLTTTYHNQMNSLSSPVFV